MLAKISSPLGTSVGETSSVVPEVRRSARPVMRPLLEIGARQEFMESPNAAAKVMKCFVHCDRRGIRSIPSEKPCRLSSLKAPVRCDALPSRDTSHQSAAVQTNPSGGGTYASRCLL